MPGLSEIGFFPERVLDHTSGDGSVLTYPLNPKLGRFELVRFLAKSLHQTAPIVAST